ncbi:MAG: ATP-binding cassette domain-containing protein [Alphaproteobacteria bacterium]|nr:ATP-binding cassette domain-containing protein [Alphaproteobacteria bacterium]
MITPNAPVIDARGLRLTYPFADRPALDGVDLTVTAGERVLLLGPSGGGKSSLALAVMGAIPHSIPADVTGTLQVFGAPVREPARLAGRVAVVFQDPDAQLCCATVADEIAFALENQCLAPEVIEARIDASLDALALPRCWRARAVASLSGGEKQLVALAAALAQQADLLILDEVTAHLDEPASRQVYAALDRALADRPHLTALFVDHRLDALIDRIDRVVVLTAQGHVLTDGPPRHVFQREADRIQRSGAWLPTATRHALTLSPVPTPLPLTVAEVQAATATVPPVSNPAPSPEEDAAPRDRPTLVPGEVLALIGATGAGKTTLALQLTGWQSGTAAAVAFQSPDHQFLTQTVLEEAGSPERLAALGLSHAAQRHPLALSQGEKRRLSLARVLEADGPAVVVLDEPTFGLDSRWTAEVADWITKARRTDRTIILVSHDLDLVAALADRVAILADRRVIAEGPPGEVLTNGALLARAGLSVPPGLALRHGIAAVTPAPRLQPGEPALEPPGVLHPFAAAVVGLAWVIAATLVMDVERQAWLALLPLPCLILGLRVGARALWRGYAGFILFGLGFFGVNLVFYDTGRSFSPMLGAVPEGVDPGLYIGATLFLRTLAIGGGSFFAVAATTPARLARALIQQARMPPRAAFATLAALQAFPVLERDLATIRLAQAVRRGRRPRRFLIGPSTALLLLAAAIRRASRAALAMEVRGLTHPMQRSERLRVWWRKRDSLVVLIGLGILAAVLAKPGL